MSVLYSAEAVSTGDGRNGLVRSSDGVLALALGAPGELGGSGESTNPEQLFAAGYSACFHSALRMAAREAGVPLRDDEVTARIHLERDESGYRISADLRVSLPGVEHEVAVGLAEGAHSRCPYSRAVRGNIRVDVAVLES